jgi:hypothetical protein
VILFVSSGVILGSDTVHFRKRRTAIEGFQVTILAHVNHAFGLGLFCYV